MHEQLQAARLSLPKQALRGGYSRGLMFWFRWGKIILSRLANLLRPRATWPQHVPFWRSLEEYAAWLPAHVRWMPDPLGGAFDSFLSPAALAAQMRDRGYVQKDCDGLAQFSALNLTYLLPRGAQDVFIVTVILDPFSFQKQALLYAAHVLCVFRHEQAWRVISNHELFPDRYPSFAAAVQHNPYCAGHPVLWFEVRDPHLKRLHSGRRLGGWLVG